MIALAVEDDLLSALGTKIVGRVRPDLQVSNVYLCSGSARLRSRLAAFNNACAAVPHLVLGDLDTAPCASQLIAEWTQGMHLHPSLRFRLAVREAEAWVMADRPAFANLLGIAVNRVPAYPEQLQDPKAELIRLARTSQRPNVRKALTPIGTARQGPEHNDFLIGFLNDTWDFDRAAANAPSLRRAADSLSEL